MSVFLSYNALPPFLSGISSNVNCSCYVMFCSTLFSIHFRLAATNLSLEPQCVINQCTPTPHQRDVVLRKPDRVFSQSLQQLDLFLKLQYKYLSDLAEGFSLVQHPQIQHYVTLNSSELPFPFL